MRRLEAGIWEEYLTDLSPDVTPDKMIIYHWRYGGGAEGAVSDVVTLAKFRRARHNLWGYALVVVLLGAFGSGVHELIMSLWNPAIDSSVGRTAASMATTIVVLLLIMYVIWKRRAN